MQSEGDDFQVSLETMRNMIPKKKRKKKARKKKIGREMKDKLGGGNVPFGWSVSSAKTLGEDPKDFPSSILFSDSIIPCLCQSLPILCISGVTLKVCIRPSHDNKQFISTEA